MNEWGVTQQGFRRKSYSNIIASMEQKAQDLFGTNIDLSSASPLALFLRVVAFGLSLLWSVAEKVYNSAFVDFAIGQSLDYAVKYAGISRRPASPARRMLQIRGDPGVTVPQGFLVETDDGGIRFATTEAVRIGPSGQVEVMAQAVTPGLSGNVSSGQLSTISNPLPGISNAVNIDHERNADGLNRESDRDLRERYYQSLAAGGASTIDSIRASVLEVPGVRTARVFHNFTMDTVDGRPPKSVEVVVLGGATEDVAQAIHRTIAAGIEPYGDITANVEDAGGETQLIRFSRAQVVGVWVSVEVTPSPAYPLDGDDRVRDEIIRYIGGIDRTGELRPGTGLGEEVIWTAVIEATRKVEGVQDVAIKIGRSVDQLGVSNITVGSREVAETSIKQISVTNI